MKRISLIVASLAILVLSGCANLTTAQQQNLQLELATAEQFGLDSVQVWCASSGIIYVIAQDVSAQSRVTTFLGGNAKAATDACPMIAAATNANIKVITGSSVPPLTPAATAPPATTSTGS